MDRRHSKLERRLKTLSVAHMPAPTSDRPQHELHDMRNHVNRVKHPKRVLAVNDIIREPKKNVSKSLNVGAYFRERFDRRWWRQQKQARNRRQSTQHRATGCAKLSLRLKFLESPSNSAAIETKKQLNRSEGTQVMDV